MLILELVNRDTSIFMTGSASTVERVQTICDDEL